MTEGLVFFFKDLKHICSYDVEQKMMNTIPLQIFPDQFKSNSFKTIIHQKNLGKINEVNEYILLFNYH